MLTYTDAVYGMHERANWQLPQSLMHICIAM